MTGRLKRRGLIEGHDLGSKFDPFRILLAWCLDRTASIAKFLLRRLAVIADGEQSILDGIANTFFNQCPRDAWNAGAVGALFHQFFEKGDGRKRQGHGNAVGLGFLCGHAKTLASYSCTEKYLLRVYSD